MLLVNFLEPALLVISERFHFHRQMQAEGETVAEFCAELKRMAAHCLSDESVLEDIIRDRFICELKSKPTQRSRLAEKELTLKKATQIVLAMESAAKSTKTLKEIGSEQLHTVTKVPRSRQHSVLCHRCGKKSHEPRNCRSNTATTAKNLDM